MRKQIRVYVDAAQWEALKSEGETDTDLQDRLIETYEAIKELSALHPDLRVAVGMALQGYQILKQMRWDVVLTEAPQGAVQLEEGVEEDTFFVDNSGDF